MVRLLTDSMKVKDSYMHYKVLKMPADWSNKRQSGADGRPAGAGTGCGRDSCTAPGHSKWAGRTGPIQGAQETALSLGQLQFLSSLLMI